MNSSLMNIHFFCCLIKIRGREGEKEGIMTATAAEQNRGKTRGRCHCRDNRNLPPAFWGDVEWRDVGSCQKIQSTHAFTPPYLKFVHSETWCYLTPLSMCAHIINGAEQKKQERTI